MERGDSCRRTLIHGESDYENKARHAIIVNQVKMGPKRVLTVCALVEEDDGRGRCCEGDEYIGVMYRSTVCVDEHIRARVESQQERDLRRSEVKRYACGHHTPFCVRSRHSTQVAGSRSCSVSPRRGSARQGESEKSFRQNGKSPMKIPPSPFKETVPPQGAAFLGRGGYKHVRSSVRLPSIAN